MASNGTPSNGTMNLGADCIGLTCTNCQASFSVQITIQAGHTFHYSADVDGTSTGSGSITANNQPATLSFPMTASSKCGTSSIATVSISQGAENLSVTKTLPCDC